MGAVSLNYSRRHPELEGNHNADNLELNYLSFVYPLPFLVFGRNCNVAINYQRKYNFAREFGLDYNASSVSRSGTIFNGMHHMDFEQDGGLSTLTPAVAIEITHRLSVGAAVNFWRTSFLSENSWTQDITIDSVGIFSGNTSLGHSEQHAEYKDFSGENLTLGALWSINNRWSLGLRYDTAFTGEAEYESIESRINMGLPGPFSTGYLSVVPRVIREKRHVRFPASFAVGAACRVNDRLTLSLDVTRTDWDDFYVKDAAGKRYSLVDFSNLDNPWTGSKFDPTYTVRFGAEYVFLPKQPEEKLARLWTLRGGLFYDEEPASGKPDGFHWPGDRGDGDPDAFYGAALGVGLQLHQRVNIDAAYQIRYGPGVNSDFVRGAAGFEEDVFQHRFLLSTVIYF